MRPSKRNEAGEIGGGVFAFNCRIDLQSDVLNNRAGGEGGGIAAVSHASIDIVGKGRVIRIEDNRVDFASDEESMGGGIYLADRNTAMTAENMHLRNNRSGSHGGGLAVVERAHAVIQRANDHPCGVVDCNLIEGNEVGLEAEGAEGAAAYVTDGALLSLIQTRVRDHHTDGARSLFYVTRAAAFLRIASSLIHSNRMSDRADYVFKVENRGKVSIALSTVTDNHYLDAAMLVTRGTAIVKGNALLGTPGSQWVELNNPEVVDSNVNIFHHGLTTPVGGSDVLGRFVQSDDRIFIDPGFKNFHLKDDNETGLLIRKQVASTDYTPLRDEDYDGTDRSANVANDVTYDIGPDQYSLGSDRPPFPVARFTDEIDQIFQSPRCLNCHAAIAVPEVVTQHFNHSSLSCTGGCYTNLGENVDLSNWHAPRDLHLHLLTSRQRCNLAKRDVVPGEFSGKNHLIQDPLIIWAVSEGIVPGGGNSNGQAPPASSLSNAGWITLVETWFRNGARCD